MADTLSPLAAALREAMLCSQKGGRMMWEDVATAAREHLSAAPPAAPTERPTCATCPYWDDNAFKDVSAYNACRRNAPRMISPPTDHHNDWTEDTVHKRGDEWCGDHPAFPAYIASRRP